MDFVAVVDQAIALLRQRGRLTYRTLQLQFQLDAEHLEALKEDLIELMVLVSYKLKSAIERGTKPDAVGRKPYHRTSTLNAAMVNASRA